MTSNTFSTFRSEFGDLLALHHPRLREAIALCDARTERPVNSRKPQPESSGAVVVLPLSGFLTQHSGGILEAFGLATGLTGFSQMFAASVASPRVRAVLIRISSPGGSTYGVSELASQIYAARGVKPVIAVADSLAASAAYWIGTAADKFYATTGGDVGSIGVYMLHQDWSAADEKAGVKTSIVSAGRFKTEANPWEPLNPEAKAAMQKSVDITYADFTGDVAKHRRTSPAVVRAGFGQGRVVNARDAVTLNMIDGVKTFSEVLKSLGVAAAPVSTAELARHIGAAARDCRPGDPYDVRTLRKKFEAKYGRQL